MEQKRVSLLFFMHEVLDLALCANGSGATICYLELIDIFSTSQHYTNTNVVKFAEMAVGVYNNPYGAF